MGRPQAGALALTIAAAALLLAVPAAATATAPSPATAAAPPALRFREDGTFVIAQLADLHYGESERLDEQTSKLQAAILTAEKPDLAALSGDQVSGFAWDGASGWFEERWWRVLAPSVSAGVPHASILGNHDAEANMGRRGILELDRQLGGNLTLTRAGPRYLPGAGNYWLDVLNATGDSPAARLWFLDSGRMGCEDTLDGWGCVPAATVAWVEERAAQLPAVPTSLAFVHIPIPEFMELWNSQPTWGAKGERTACPLRSTGVLAAFRRLGIQAVYSGHDHRNDFYGTLGGVRLAYGRKTGFANYGPDGPKGARLVRLRLGQSAAESETWIREEGGAVDDQGRAEPTLPAGKRKQHACSANGWLWQRLHYASFRAALVSCAAAAAILAALSASIAAHITRRRLLRGGRGAASPSGGSADEEQAFLRSIPLSPTDSWHAA